ncbi:hypothetical protein FDP41_013273 [Naegleria fowleri]|uniref:AN1-type domain-containing protein n=1 Tax=Naegleria fowleri TaxID=5763 RepID=A0A6A5C4J2_NAEFO|nr:uncharacterized protein FDP41_013273 [Naegleria fowleri]KAF0980790.1 hypothetical protein FDP41_013273 [Naegleria fowleri]CAG4711082.1 unnamed protein product [Naegleria fowleri]
MTEFYDLGKHCCVETCRQKDFLPFHCPHCKQYTCSKHRECSSHQCPAFNIETELKKSEIPQCPLCGVFVSKQFPLEDNNLVINRHIERGCQVEKRKDDNCSFGGCNEFQMCKCSHCNKSYCSFHRHAEDHHCTHLKKKIVQQERKQVVQTSTTYQLKTDELSQSNNELLRKLHNENQAEKNKHSTSKMSPSASKPTTPNSSLPSSFVIPLKNKHLDDADAVKTTVYITLDSKGLPMKLSRLWSVGKALDLIADYGKIKNNNHKLPQDSDDRLHLYKLSNGQANALPISKRIEEVLSNGDVIILDSQRNTQVEPNKLLNLIPIHPCAKEEVSFIEKLTRNYKQIFSQ